MSAPLFEYLLDETERRPMTVSELNAGVKEAIERGGVLVTPASLHATPVELHHSESFFIRMFTGREVAAGPPSKPRKHE